MLALRWHGRRDIRLDIVDIPAVDRPIDVLLAVEACGICGTDIEEWREGPIAIPAEFVQGEAQRALVLGHEFCGRVIDAGRDAPFERGQLVAVEVNIPCGSCAACRDQRSNNCPSVVALGLQDNGGLAEFVVVPASSCIAVAESVDPRVLAFAEPLAVAVHAVSRINLQPRDSIAIFGAGAIGLLLALLFRNSGHSVTLVECLAARRELASQLGFHVIDTELAGQKRAEFDACFEATGNPSAISDAVDATRPGGSVVLLGVSTRDLGLSAWRLVEGELSLIASKSHTMKDFAEAVEALVSGAIDVSAFPLELFPLEDALLAFAGVMAQPDAYVKRMMVALPLMGTNG